MMWYNEYFLNPSPRAERKVDLSRSEYNIIQYQHFYSCFHFRGSICNVCRHTVYTCIHIVSDRGALWSCIFLRQSSASLPIEVFLRRAKINCLMHCLMHLMRMKFREVSVLAAHIAERPETQHADRQNRRRSPS